MHTRFAVVVVYWGWASAVATESGIPEPHPVAAADPIISAGQDVTAAEPMNVARVAEALAIGALPTEATKAVPAASKTSILPTGANPDASVSDWSTPIQRFVDHWGKLFELIFSLAVAAFTGFLWWSTDKLWKSGQQQISAAKDAADAALVAANVAKDSFLAEHRPWILTTVKIAAPQSWANGTFTIRIEFNLKNTGRTPATFVYARPILHPVVPPGFDVVDAQMQMAQAVLTETSSSKGLTIFPGEPDVMAAVITVDDEWIGGVRRWFKEQGEENPQAVDARLYGVIGYRSTVENRVHRTGFIYDVIGLRLNEGEVARIMPELKKSLLGGLVVD